MKFILLVSVIFINGVSFATEVQYDMKVDGITCPFCVATSAKELNKIDGVKRVSSDLKAGLIKVCADEKVTFNDEQLQKLFLDKGFTYRSMSKKRMCDADESE